LTLTVIQNKVAFADRKSGESFPKGNAEGESESETLRQKGSWFDGTLESPQEVGTEGEYLR
jgi:hypothetical protein